jgi:adenylate kinase
MVKVAAVFGLSGVGKSWLISRFAASSHVMHVQASQLLKDERAKVTGELVTSEALRTGAVLDNQSLLIRAFSRTLVIATIPIILDGHCVVDSDAGLIDIPVDVIEALSVSGIVFVQDRPEAIVARRANDRTRTRPAKSEAEIECHQEHAVSLCENYSDQLKIGLHLVRAGDEPTFRAAISAILDV